ncbi:MAG: toxin-antitoxin system YwqK family antitoxin [Crocinitomicaceae bacterium]
MKRKIVFLIAFFWTTIGMSQEISKDLYLKRSIRQDNQHFQFKVLESTFGNGHAYKQHKFYYWFKSQTVVCTQGAASGQLLHGLFESFYDNKQLSSKGIFDKGLKHGVWTYWNQKGIIVKTETWDYGVKRGDEKHYDDHGTLLTTIDYGFKNNQRVTKDSIIYTTKEGIYKKVILLDSIGNDVKKIKYKDGMPLREPQGKLREPQGKLREPQGVELKGEDGKTERKKSKDLETKEKESFWKRIVSTKKQDATTKQTSTSGSWKFWKKKSTKQTR